ncbi:glycosyltransferase family 4 protein [Thermus thermophilus]|uniref:Glycosyl transferase family 1 n=1 Tax=Thermus thermophilus TaxID=274 RepID=A0AAD1NWN6_THETH|nr:glycosyltransferase family 4 protein [Thermus thermophilus]BBL81896.1 glycosyl transferase family 1 [Thermus thermophilus]BBL84199.1 glycosyl transferase family 1 [Thermus thermophilus]BCZ86513.1 glycosyl transferase family 1 [Thermus thermophilus]BCZ88899.1 glycosyl transferase family 1 [Thermus thermophilus]
MRVAFVHDWLTAYAGAEKVLEAALELYPTAPIYTLVYQQESFKGSRIAEHPVHTSFIERLPKGREKYRAYLPLMPLAIEQFDLSGYDVVISSSHAVAKGVLTRADQLHISYVHTPIRYAWDLQFQYLKEAGIERGLKSAIARVILHYIRLWDVASSNRVDVFVANSHYVAQRIWKFYRREAQVIYPPVDVDRFTPKGQREDFYLTLSRFVPYKKIDLIVEAFTRLGLPLVVIGDGPDFNKVKRIAGPNVQLLGYQPDTVVKDYMERCKAFVFAADEDFGITPVEAQAAGAPVIAYGRGGVTETVLHGETGLFFQEQTVESLLAAVRAFESGEYQFDPERLRQNAERFSKKRFQQEFSELVEREWAKFTRVRRVRW